MRLFICGSYNENFPKEIYDDCEGLLNQILVDNDLLFGASDRGIMGLAYRIAKKNNRNIIGMCPPVYAEAYDILECDKEIITENMVDSTVQIINNSDVIIIMPGGFGTLYELFTAIQTKICNEHNLPIIIYNSCGYYNELEKFMETIFNTSFANEEVKGYYTIANNKEEISEVLKKITV